MKSRFQVALGLLAVVTAAIAGTAAAQRSDSPFAKIAGEGARLPANPAMEKVAKPGDYRFSFESGGVSREYRVHVPASYHGQPAAMLLALHGGGGSADYQADDSRYGLISSSERHGFILVLPNGYSRWRNGMLATWNAGACCGPAQRNAIDDVGFIKAVIARMKQQANVDPARVFVTGMSNGAMMSWRLACELSEIRAIAPVEGTDNTTACRPSHPVAVIEFHALDDDMVPFAGGRGSSSLTQVDFASVASSQAKWVALNQATRQAQRVLAVPGAYCDRQAGKTPVELCVTETGGHSWPGGGTQQGRKQPSHAINANELMWRFFSSL